MHAMSVDDAYRIEHTLSEGPTGTTELVTLNGSGPFLRKRIPSDAARRAVWAVLADCDCPFLPRVWATYELPDEFVVVYDYVAGTTLKDHISSNGALAPREAVGLAENVCAAAKAPHDHGVIHRDISPSNVIVSHDGAHLIDLGITSTRFACENHEEEHYGTWGFAAPEQYGFAQTDARSDVYSIGRLLGYMLTGVLPDDETYEQRLHDPDAVPPALLGVVACACAFEPSSRYQTAEELAQAARSALEQQDVREEAPAAPPEHDDAPQAEQRSQDSPAPVRRSRGKIALAAGALGVAGLLAALILLHGEPAGPTGKDTQPEPTASSSEDVEPSDSADSPDSPDTDVSPDTDTSPDAGASSDTDDSRESSTGPGAETASAEPDPTEPAPAVESDGDAPGSENDTPVSADEDTSGLLAAASRNDADVSPVAANSGDDAADSILQIVDAWWDYQSGTVRFILGVTNTSADTVIKVPQVRVTGKASDGSIVFSQTASFFPSIQAIQPTAHSRSPAMKPRITSSSASSNRASSI